MTLAEEQSCKYDKEFRDRLFKLEDEFHVLKERFIILETSFTEFRQSLLIRLEALNELRNQVLSDRSQFMRIETYQLNHADVTRQLDELKNWKSGMIEHQTQQDTTLARDEEIIASFNRRVDTVERWQNKMIGIGITITFVTAMLGATIDHFFFKLF